MSETGKDAPRRYIVDDTGRRILVGLTIEETLEFERLDSPAALSLYGKRVIWNARDAGPERPEPRWLELYSKHERAWSEWMAESRVRNISPVAIDQNIEGRFRVRGAIEGNHTGGSVFELVVQTK